MANKTNNRAGGKAVKEKYGPEHFRELGRKGFEETTRRYFGGDRKAHLEWLRRKGAFAQDSGLSYHKPEIFPDPGPHPAHVAELTASEEHAALVAWLIDTEQNITS